MSAGFVSGGTIDNPDDRKEAVEGDEGDDDWAEARRELEAQRRQRQEQSRQPDGKSLFETLQANKAAKQEAFEEANKLKNQFRSLDEDEIEFLDSVLEKERAEELRVAKETKDGLEAFRKQQEEIDRKRRVDEPGEYDDTQEVVESWANSSRKRRRHSEKGGFKGLKLKKSDSTVSASSAVSPPTNTQRKPSVPSPIPDKEKPTAVSSSPKGPNQKDQEITTPSLPAASVASSKPKMASLVDYGSDDDDGE